MNCKGCGAEISPTQKFCGQCGQPLNVPDENSGSEPEVGATSVEKGANGWIKVCAICLILLTGLFGCQQLRASQLEGCRESALQASSAITVLNVRVGVFQCEYLIRHNYSGAKADWVEPFIFDIYLPDEEK